MYRLAASAAALFATAASAASFDAVADRQRVLACYAVHFEVGIYGRELLRLPSGQWEAEDVLALRRQRGLEPYVQQLGLTRQQLMNLSAQATSARRNQDRLAAMIPGQKSRILAAAVQRSRDCEAMVSAWNAAAR